MTPRKVRFGHYLAYGSNDFLGAGAMSIIGFWILFFYTTFCGLSATQATIIFATARLLDAFFSLHDPTTLNRQGPDWGTQYRSVIFFHSPDQEAQARAKIEQLTAEGRFKPKRIVTHVVPAETFWRAEEYHQRYLEKRGQASCHI